MPGRRLAYAVARCVVLVTELQGLSHSLQVKRPSVLKSRLPGNPPRAKK